jgi:enterochelin esterase-like enzyme/sugar lactone lactonase YvrE
MLSVFRPEGRSLNVCRLCGALAALVMLPLLVMADAPNGADASRGEIRSGTFDASLIFPGTTRGYAVYVPAEYDGSEPAALMVFQDGPAYLAASGAFRTPQVFDELMAAGEMPVAIAVFVEPGRVAGERDGASDRSNRSFEYDSLGDRYVRFLQEELLPVALEGLSVSTDPRQRAICGISSGGICSFTAAWERPDLFGRVMSHIGSFTNIRGGDAYPVIVRKTKDSPKPVRIYLQEGRDDLDNLFGSWPLGNEDMASALRFAGYEHRYVLTGGGHSGTEAGRVFAEGLRWLWSDEPGDEPAAVPTSEPPVWEPHPDAVPRENVPQGRVEAMPPLASTIFPNTVRDWWVYVPAQASRETACGVMVFQDGHDYVSREGRWRVPVVFDNLIAAGDMPPTVAVFLNPGHDPAKGKPDNPWRSSNRSFEYDSLGDRYARFLIEEVLPEVAKLQPISDDPAMRGIGGASSGGICSFTVAWERPDAFAKVYSTIGSYTGLRGGDAYPGIIRKTEPVPLRVYLADTSGDLDNPFGSWPISNRRMAAALASTGYDHRFDWAEGFAHDSRHASMLFPDAMRWLWRAEASPPKVDTSGNLAGDMTLMKLLIPGEGWQLVADGLGFADGPCCDAEGNFLYCDMRAGEIRRVSAADDSVSVVAAEAVSGLEFGPDGTLYACQGSRQRVIAIDPATGVVTEVASGLEPNDLAVTADGLIFITETGKRQVTRIDPATGEVTAVDTGITGPNGIAISNDGGTLAVSDYLGGHTWMFRVTREGRLDAKSPTMVMRLPIDPDGQWQFRQPPPRLEASRGDGMAVDAVGRWYVTSAEGVQVFDPTGRLSGVLPAPRQDAPLTSCILAGRDRDCLYVTNGSSIWRRKLAVR